MRRREFLAIAAGAPQLLAARGGSAYSICLSREASASERRGAHELQDFIFQMGGAHLPIVSDDDSPPGALILVGRSAALDRLDVSIPFEALGAEGYALKTVGPHVVIAGGRQRGTMYGVYGFLEKLGCRWYAPDCSLVPRMARFQIPLLDEVQKPAFEYRELFMGAATDKDWAARNRINGSFANLDESTGGKVTWYPGGHTFYQIIPPEKYFSTHPEYFSLVNRERRSTRAQLCLTNPDVLRISIETVSRWMDEHPDVAMFSVSENDCDGHCECENCRRVEEQEGAASGPILHYVNAIAEAVYPKHPDKLIHTFAYNYSEKPPTRVRAHPNVRVQLAASGACQGHPFEQCPRNRFIMQRLRDWSRVTPHLHVWHYITNFYQFLAPFPNLDELSADMAMYHRNGVVGLFLEGDFSRGGSGELSELRSYLLAKLAWNPSADAAAIIGEFVRAYYGPAAPALRDYIEWTHREVRLPPRGRGSSMYLYRGPSWSAEFLPGARAIFQKVQKPEKPEFARRLEKAELSLDWFELMEARRLVLKDGTYGPRDPEDLTKKCDAFFPKARAFGITDLRESGGIDKSEQDFRRRVTPFATATLENEWLKAVVVPGLHGRVISLFNKKTSREALRQPVPEIALDATDLLGGLVLLVHPEHYSRKEFEAKWQLESADSAGELVLGGDCHNGLRLHRVLRLRSGEPTLETFTVIENSGSAPLQVALQSRADVNPGNPDDPVIHFAYQRQGGGIATEQLLPPLADNYGDEFFRDEQRPDGEWRLVNPAIGLALVNRFSLGQVERCRLWWRGRKQNTVSLGLWSPERTLRPGESLRLEAEYRAEPA